MKEKDKKLEREEKRQLKLELNVLEEKAKRLRDGKISIRIPIALRKLVKSTKTVRDLSYVHRLGENKRGRR